MGYYETQQKMFQRLEMILKSGKDNGIDYDYLVYQLTMSYPVGETAIKKRLETMKKIDMVEFDNGMIYYKEAEA